MQNTDFYLNIFLFKNMLKRYLHASHKIQLSLYFYGFCHHDSQFLSKIDN